MSRSIRSIRTPSSPCYLQSGEDEESGEEGEESEGDDFDYTKLKVSELKSIAEQKGLSGYKSLKKTPLIELLKSSE